MDPNIHIVCVYNYFDPLAPGGRDIRHLPWEKKTMRALASEFYHPCQSTRGYDIVVTIDGAPFAEETAWELIPAPGASVVFALVPQGGNGKNPLATVALLAVMVAAYAYAPPLGAVLSGYTGLSAVTSTALAYAGTMIAGSMLINAVLGPPLPDSVGLPAGLANSATYGWGADTNRVYEGGPLPVLYGTHRVIPPRIGKYVSTENGKQVLNLLFAVAGHPLDAIDNVEINDTPMEDFNDPAGPACVTVATRLGANDQIPIPEFLDTIAETPVGVKLSSSWTTRQTAGNAACGLGLCVLLPKGLFYANDAGEMENQSVDLIAEYKLAAAGEWTAWLNNTVTGSSNSAVRLYFRQDNLTAGQYDVRVKLAVDPPEGMRYGSDVYWESLQEIVYDDFAYPGVSLLGVKILATDKLSGGIPTVACRAARNNVTVWNGSADVDKAANLPPWICCDILRNEEYGGQTDKTRLVYTAFDAWADWCADNDLACNIYLDSAFSLRKALDTVGLLGRGNVVQLGSRFTCIVDRPEETPVQRFLFTAGNIIKDSFTIDWLPYEGRANALEVTYFDSEINYSRQSFLLKSDDFETMERPVEPAAITLVGCTNRAMAVKHGAAQLKRNRYLTMMPSWSAAVDAIACMPGDVVEVAHDRPQWGFSGRVVSATNGTVTLDREVTLQPATTYMVTVLHAADDAREDRYVSAVEEETTTDTLTLAANWTDNPVQYDLYSFGEENHVVQLVRIGRITRSQEMRRKITSLEYLAEAFDDSAQIGVYEAVSALIDVADLRACEIYKFRTDGIGLSVVSLTWRGQSLKWQVFYRLSGDSPGPWIHAGETRYPAYEIGGLSAGLDYDFAVTSTGAIDPDKVVTWTYSGLPAGAPDAPTGFTATLSGRFIDLAWTAATDVMVAAYSIYLNDLPVVTNYNGTTYIYKGVLSAGDYDFTLRTVNQYGQESDDSEVASLTIEVPSTPTIVKATNGQNCILTWDTCKTSLDIAYYTVNDIQVSTPEYTEKVAWDSKEFTVVAVDVAGNESDEAVATVTIPALNTISAIVVLGRVYSNKVLIVYRPSATFEALEIWAATVNDRDSASKIAETTSASIIHAGLALGATWYYWARARNTLKEYGAWYPLSSSAGVAGTVSSNAADYLALLNIDETNLSATLQQRIANIDSVQYLFDPDVFEEAAFDGLNGAYTALAEILTQHDADIASVNTKVETLELVGLSVWDSGTEYALGATVIYQTIFYESLQEQNLNHVPSTSPTWWEKTNASLETRMTAAEENIVAGQAGEWGSISEKATTIITDALDVRISETEGDIAAGMAGEWSSISEKATVASISDANGYSRIAAIENRLQVYDTTDVPAYGGGTTYYPGTLVKSANTYYRCIKETIGHAPPNATYWTAISAGMVAEWTLKLNANNHIAGVGLALDGFSGASEFIILADKFQIIHPDDTGDPVAMFVVGEVEGVTTVGIAGNLMVDGSILTNALIDHAVTIPVSAWSAYDIALDSPGTTTIQSCTIVSTGGDVLINCSANIHSVYDDGIVASYWIRRGESTILNEINISQGGYSGSASGCNLAMTIVDAPGAGTFTYYLDVILGSGWDLAAKSRSMTVLEVKK